jgi:8-oxo-dGTP diphosphatase
MSSRPAIAVAALIRQGEDVLLVQQQAPENPGPSWALPGGVVEADESLSEALSREIREETGLTLHEPGSLLYVTQVDGNDESWTAFIFDSRSWSGTLQPADPDECILDARFLPVPDAIVKLETMPIRCMQEPIVSYLRGETGSGALWCYREDEDGSEMLVEVLPGR